MSSPTPDFWTQWGEGFQENLAKSWGQAMQHFQTIDLGGLKSSAAQTGAPLQFSQEKLKTLQRKMAKAAVS